MVAVIASGLWRSGAISATRAAAFGIAPPRPTPAAKRTSVNIGMRRDECGDERQHAKGDDAAKERGAAAGTIAEHAAQHAAEHHSEWRRRRRGGERRARQVPLTGQRWNGIREQLTVHPVEDDHARRRGDYEPRI